MPTVRDRAIWIKNLKVSARDRPIFGGFVSLKSKGANLPTVRDRAIWIKNLKVSARDRPIFGGFVSLKSKGG